MGRLLSVVLYIGEPFSFIQLMPKCSALISIRLKADIKESEVESIRILNIGYSEYRLGESCDGKRLAQKQDSAMHLVVD